MKKKIEISSPPRLNEKEHRVLDLHSAINALQSVMGEFFMITDGDPVIEAKLEPFGEAIKSIAGRALAFENPPALLREVLKMADPLEAVLDEIEDYRRRSPRAGARSVNTLRTILAVVRVRIGELFDREHNGRQWREVPIDELVGKLTDVFAAIARHSRGRYAIAFDPEEKAASDYLVQFKFEGCGRATFFAPPELQDILRDLTANARKYTAPGGTILVTVRQDDRALHGSIADTGIGIPPDEMERVCQFGHRGSNVAGARTLGAGFGLTKAVCLVKSWGGRFWIASELERGTEMSFTIPLPPERRRDRNPPSQALAVAPTA